MATAARKTNWFAIWTSIIIAVIVIGIGVAVVVANNIAKTPPPALENAPVATAPSQDGVVSMGGGSEVVSTYIDFMCPFCNQFETTYGDQLLDLAANDKITLEVRPVNMLDGQSSTQYSTRSANAFFCVADTDGAQAATYLRALYDEQPREGGPGLDDARLIEIAKAYGVDIATCQKDLTFADLAVANYDAMPASADGSRGTPTVAVNGAYNADFWNSETWFSDNFGG